MAYYHCKNEDCRNIRMFNKESKQLFDYCYVHEPSLKQVRADNHMKGVEIARRNRAHRNGIKEDSLSNIVTEVTKSLFNKEPIAITVTIGQAVYQISIGRG